MTEVKKHWWALPYILGILSSITGIFIGLGTKLLKDMNLYYYSYLRSIAIVVINYFFIKRAKVPIYPSFSNRKICRLIEIRFILGFACATTMIVGIQNVPLSLGTVLLQTVPIWTGIFGKFYFNEEFGKNEIISCAISFVGVLIITKPPIPFFSQGNSGNSDFFSSFPYYMLCLLNAALWAYACLIARQIRSFTNNHTLNLHFAASMLIFSPPFINDSELSFPTFKQCSIIILTACITMLTWWLINEAFKYEEASKIMPFNYTGLIFTGIFDKIFFNYVPTLSSIVGALLIAGSCIFLVVMKRKQQIKPVPRRKRVSEINVS
eukprot:TRINITY_DN12196_c0_g1_i1.p1 TRINITY_DN12196_c0_g1~~TRINITY_DN12196_c0_g1_i1.p1  ORF type:complete len:322 (-),score=14.48 TRINITY_DN12196_c0_g1_i1:146-1111(-)